MKIVICVKQVPDTSDIKWTENNTIQREGLECFLNPYDAFAIESALKIKKSVENVETEDNIAVETYDDFDDDSVAIETEEISLDDFGTVFDTPDEPKEETKPTNTVKADSLEERLFLMKTWRD